MTDDTERTKLVGLRIRLTPEEYRFAEFYGKEFSYGHARDYLRALLRDALAREMRQERELKARLKAEEGEMDSSQPPEGSFSLHLDDEIPF